MRVLGLLLLLMLNACGFKPSNVIELSDQNMPFLVNSKDPYSGLADNIGRVLNSSGVRIAGKGEAANTISIHEEDLEKLALSLDSNAQVTEYRLRYRVIYSLVGIDGGTLIDKQAIELRRDFNYDVTISSGSPAEEALLKREMQDEMVRAILRRASVVMQPAVQ
jgi:LPS-assembly lipoprotein